MNTPLRLPSPLRLAGLALFALVSLLFAQGCAGPGHTAGAWRAELGPVEFKTSHAQFIEGDRIVIQEVRASSPQWQVGDTVIVRGTYRLASAPGASLGLMLTRRGPGPSQKVAPQQRQTIAGGEGAFELTHVIAAEGSLHVSFYPEHGGSSFGGVYLSPAGR